MKKKMLIVVLIAASYILGAMLLAAEAQESQKKAGETSAQIVQLTETELKEAGELAALVQQAKREFEQAQAALYGSAVYQQFEAARARLSLAAKSQENAFNVACGEHGIKPSECEGTADGKGLKRKEPSAPAPAK